MIPFDSIGYELRPSANLRGIARTVKKQTTKVMGWDIKTVKKEIAVMTEKLTQKKNKLRHLEEQATRTSKTAIAYHAAKYFVKSVVGTKKSDSKHASHVEHGDSSPERRKAEDGAIDGAEQEKTVPDKYDPASEASEHKGKGGMSTPKSRHPKHGNRQQKVKGKAGKMPKKPEGTPHHAAPTPGGNAHKAVTKAKAKAGNFFKMAKGKAAALFKGKKKK